MMQWRSQMRSNFFLLHFSTWAGLFHGFLSLYLAPQVLREICEGAVVFIFSENERCKFCAVRKKRP